MTFLHRKHQNLSDYTECRSSLILADWDYLFQNWLQCPAMFKLLLLHLMKHTEHLNFPIRTSTYVYVRLLNWLQQINSALLFRTCTHVQSKSKLWADACFKTKYRSPSLQHKDVTQGASHYSLDYTPVIHPFLYDTFIYPFIILWVTVSYLVFTGLVGGNFLCQSFHLDILLNSNYFRTNGGI